MSHLFLQLVPEGYKRTEIGVIPSDWKIENIVNLCNVIDGDRGSNYPSGGDFSEDGYCAFLSATNVTKVGFKFDEVSFISKDKDQLLRKGKLKKGDIVLTTRGSVGHFSYFDKDVPYENMRINSGMVLLRNESDEVDTNYLYLLLRSFVVGRQIERLSFGSAQPQLTVKGINEFLVLFPETKKEQTAIANALSDVDALIASLEKLIAKKRAIKTAAMQQLLTGKKRLPPFCTGKCLSGDARDGEEPVDKTHTGYKQTELGEIPVDWVVRELQEVAKVKGGKRLPKGELLLKSPTNIPYIRVADMFVGGVDLSDIRYVPENVAPVIKNYRIKSTDLFISVAGTLGIVGKIPDILDGANLTENADKLTDITVNRDYLLYWLLSEKIQNAIISQSTVGAQPKLALGRIEGFKIAFPKELGEQAGISQVLSDIDKEIDTLEQRLTKTQQLKQGMMQELLTGRTRLV